MMNSNNNHSMGSRRMKIAYDDKIASWYSVF